MFAVHPTEYSGELKDIKYQIPGNQFSHYKYNCESVHADLLFAAQLQISLQVPITASFLVNALNCRKITQWIFHNEESTPCIRIQAALQSIKLFEAGCSAEYLEIVEQHRVKYE